MSNAKRFDALYHVTCLYPRRQMSGCGFNVKLYPAMRQAVAELGAGQTNIDNWLSYRHNDLLTVHGFDADLYCYGSGIRVSWGEWGPEHISVPGNACGLDLDMSTMHAPPGGRVLTPHNVDSIMQSHLLLCVFTGLADTLMLNQECRALRVEPIRVPVAAAAGQIGGGHG